MIYSCKLCGASFPTTELKKAIANKEDLITCKYCNTLNEFREMKTSHVAKGFDYLSLGDFHRATMEFNYAIENAKNRGKTPPYDAYLGYALAQFRVRTMFSDDDPDRLEFPQLVCETCNEMEFGESAYYVRARQAIMERREQGQDSGELRVLEYCRDYIDTIRDYYIKIKNSKSSNFEYGVFIAYEDSNRPGEFNQGENYAKKVRNYLPDEIKNVFMPDRDEYSDDLEYEAAIIYALEHSKCMLVIADDNIDSRLTALYSRFYLNKHNGSKTSVLGRNLGFVRYCGHVTIALPDETIATNNVFDFENKDDYVKFVRLHNNLITQTVKVVKGDIGGDRPDDEKKSITEVGSRQFIFGNYPQKRELNVQIEQLFSEKFGKPSMSDNNGWQPMYYSKKGNPYMWYRDEVLNGKKYRGVYFTQLRDAYTVQKSNVAHRPQRANGYMPMRVYCFSFEPIVWDVEDMSLDVAYLVSSQALDSKEYNASMLDNEWENSTMHVWLNEDFMYTAFGEEERNKLCSLTGDGMDKVYLTDKLFDKEFYTHRHTAIMGSDYFKCIGGMGGERGINSYWITDSSLHGGSEASIIYPDVNYTVDSTHVDSTLVAVLPKIVVKM